MLTHLLDAGKAQVALMSYLCRGNFSKVCRNYHCRYAYAKPHKKSPQTQEPVIIKWQILYAMGMSDVVSR